MGWLVIPLAALILGLVLGHWLAIPLTTLVWLAGLVFVAVFVLEEGGGSLADGYIAVAMLLAGYLAAGVGVALRRLVNRRRVAI